MSQTHLQTSSIGYQCGTSWMEADICGDLPNSCQYQETQIVPEWKVWPRNKQSVSVVEHDVRTKVNYQ